MADNSNNILNQLQQYKLNPPADAFNKAWEKILLQKKGDADRSTFSNLKEYSIQAPALDFKSVAAGGKAIAKKKKFAIFISAMMMKVAAALLIVAASVVVYLIMLKKDTTGDPYAAGQEAGNSEQNKPEAVQKDTGNGIRVGATATIPGNGSSDKNKTGSKEIRWSDNKSAESFYNNDVFFTLVNYKEYDKEKLFAKTIADKKVTLNKYSYVNLSDRMVGMLQEIYLTRKNGKPARKAKRAKKKFDKWRKKDEKYFDRDLNKNPVDIIDLGDFLMKN